MKKTIALALGIVCACLSFAQQKISGRLVDAINHLPVENATIKIGEQSTLSNSKGEFIIDCNNDAELHVTCSGFEPFHQNSHATSSYTLH